jgi:hypothetical protein
VLVAWSAVARQRRSWRRRCDAACRFKLETVDANAKRRTLLAWREQVAANTLRLPTLRHYLVRWTRGAIEVRGNRRGFPWSGPARGGLGSARGLQQKHTSGRRDGTMLTRCTSLRSHLFDRCAAAGASTSRLQLWPVFIGFCAPSRHGAPPRTCSSSALTIRARNAHTPTRTTPMQARTHNTLPSARLVLSAPPQRGQGAQGGQSA